jgi:sugar phosphate isomerase/epimerase
MHLASRPGADLTYCTNIHPGNGWADVFSQLKQYTPALKQRLSPDRPFGVGLRLSNVESEELLTGSALDDFARFLDENGLYVALINGFPFGSFHRTVVKEDVFAPDWRDPRRVEYTRRLIRILERLLLEGADGGISTIPLSYKPWVKKDSETRRQIAHNLSAIARELDGIFTSTGKRIHIDIEPEPNGLIENSAETLDFFVSDLKADALLLEYLTVCFDTCHMAVEYEDTVHAVKLFRDNGIKIGRLQISSALQIDLALDRKSLRRHLEPFAESTYLHQVIERRRSGELRRYLDLPNALAQIEDPDAFEWRIHFHVPIFVEKYGTFGSTQQYIFDALRVVQTPHIEIETYTWDVLPKQLKQDLLNSITREFQWIQLAIENAAAQNCCS